MINETQRSWFDKDYKYEHGSVVISSSMVIPDVWLLAQNHLPIFTQAKAIQTWKITVWFPLIGKPEIDG